MSRRRREPGATRALYAVSMAAGVLERYMDACPASGICAAAKVARRMVAF